MSYSARPPSAPAAACPAAQHATNGASAGSPRSTKNAASAANVAAGPATLVWSTASNEVRRNAAKASIVVHRRELVGQLIVPGAAQGGHGEVAAPPRAQLAEGAHRGRVLVDPADQAPPSGDDLVAGLDDVAVEFDLPQLGGEPPRQIGRRAAVHTVATLTDAGCLDPRAR